MNFYVKQPQDALTLQFDFVGLLGLQAMQLTSVAALPRNPQAVPLTILAQQMLGTQARVQIAGGGDGQDYILRLNATSADGQIASGEIEVQVAALGFIVPTGTAAYLSVSDYIDRFGREEALRLTDETQIQRIDGKRLMAALYDACAEVDSFVAAKYELPLAIIPARLVQIAADLARLNLYTRACGATETVTKAAEQARAALANISKGLERLVLPAQSLPAAPLPQNNDAPMGGGGMSKFDLDQY